VNLFLICLSALLCLSVIIENIPPLIGSCISFESCMACLVRYLTCHSLSRLRLVRFGRVRHVFGL
jgi:hypothetical protein